MISLASYNILNNRSSRKSPTYSVISLIPKIYASQYSYIIYEGCEIRMEFFKKLTQTQVNAFESATFGFNY